MSQVQPGEIRAAFPAPSSPAGRAAGRGPGGAGPGHHARHHPLEPPELLRLLPKQHELRLDPADIVASGFGVQGMSWQTSPAATELEEVVMDWLRQMAGLSGAWSGVVHDTASTATLTALLCARERASAFSPERRGLQSAARPPRSTARTRATAASRRGPCWRASAAAPAAHPHR